MNVEFTFYSRNESIPGWNVEILFSWFASINMRCVCRCALYTRQESSNFIVKFSELNLWGGNGVARNFYSFALSHFRNSSFRLLFYYKYMTLLTHLSWRILTININFCHFTRHNFTYPPPYLPRFLILRRKCECEGILRVTKHSVIFLSRSTHKCKCISEYYGNVNVSLSSLSMSMVFTSMTMALQRRDTKWNKIKQNCNFFFNDYSSRWRTCSVNSPLTHTRPLAYFISTFNFSGFIFVVVTSSFFFLLLWLSLRESDVDMIRLCTRRNDVDSVTMWTA